MSADKWLLREVEQLRAQNAELRARLELIETDFSAFVLPGDEFAPLTPTERSIVKIMFDRNGSSVSKKGIHDVLYALRGDREVPDPKIIDVLICKLRPKLTAWLVETHWGIGYSLRRKEQVAA